MKARIEIADEGATLILTTDHEWECRVLEAIKSLGYQAKRIDSHYSNDGDRTNGIEIDFGPSSTKAGKRG